MLKRQEDLQERQRYRLRDPGLRASQSRDEAKRRVLASTW
jgi:hypothetical protein